MTRTIRVALPCLMAVTLFFAGIGTTLAAPKLTAERAKKYFGDVNAPKEVNTGFEKKMLLPLQIAAGNKKPLGQEMIRALVEAGAKINKVGPDGDAAIHTAAWRNTARNISELVKHGANVNLKNKQGETALLKAIDYRSFNAVKALLEAGADPNISDSQGNTAVHLAVKEGDTDLALKILGLLLSHKANLEATNKEGHTPLQQIISLPHASEIPMVQFLLDSGANPRVTDSVSGTPLHEIADGNMTDKLVPLLDLFVKNGADLNNRDNMFRETPLHKAIFRACLHGELKITRRLLELGANPDLKNKDGTSAKALVNAPELNCSKEVKQLLASVSANKVAKAATSPSDTGSSEKQTDKSLNDVIKAYANHVDTKGSAYQQAKQKAAKARGFSGLNSRNEVQSRQHLFSDFKDKAINLIILLKDAKAIAWKAVQENKVQATQRETEKAIKKKFGDRITEKGLQPLQAQFYWADAYYNVFTMLDQHWGAWSVDEAKHMLNAPDKALQAKLNKEMKAIADLESYLNQQGK